MKFIPLKKILYILLSGTLLSAITTGAQSKGKTNEVNNPVYEHHKVQITGFEFIPKNLTVKVGDTVTWVNKDIVPHNIYNSANKKSISPNLATGESFSYTVPAFKVIDTLGYFCNFHPSMAGELRRKK